ncbi:uncharacterized protein LOC123430053 [Hordeum vulgare subsp. vulgare]|uniref:uncharacterized protein LOC123430053 n=1 Tax=Hordeum vulgare subsp. vulgare TaxID=112509 RepID=UPI00162D4D30|nr:uncharacterized protein LOC123430053 [Hordeum vulgare subsp. vulgare]
MPNRASPHPACLSTTPRSLSRWSHGRSFICSPASLCHDLPQPTSEQSSTADVATGNGQQQLARLLTALAVPSPAHQSTSTCQVFVPIHHFRRAPISLARS